jgi:uncharacterized membrane-anchored protein YitT (DUF2179 family)
MNLKKKITSAELLLQAKNLGLVLLGTLVLAFGCAIFVVPFNLVTGGVTGIAIIINELIHGAISIDIVIGVITWGLFLLGLVVLGWDFAMKTLASTIVYPLAISLFMHLVSPDFLGGIFHLQSSAHSDIALIISALFGGLCVGTGCALTFLGGGSTGGVDIIAFILCKLFKKWKSSTVIFLIDATTVALGLFVIKDLILTLLGIISAWLAAMVIDKIFLGREQAFTAQIVSDKFEEINLAIRDEVRRTTTMFVAFGGYSREGKTVLSVTFTMRQYADLMNVIKRIDPTAFVSIARAHEINGEGWTYGEHD